MTFEKLETMFLNGCLHFMGYARGGHHILVVDMEGKHGGKFLIGRVVLDATSIKLRSLVSMYYWWSQYVQAFNLCP